MPILSLHYTPEQIAELREKLRERMLREAPYVRQPNFTKLADRDVLLLFRLYDELFLNRELQPLLTSKTPVPMKFRVSRGMTSAGGKTITRRRRVPGAPYEYEIAISGTLLFSSFNENDRPVVVSGQPCRDRLDALMRIMEHELVHLIEMLTFGNSSCSKTRFLTIAQRLFGHTNPKHQLVSVHERAAIDHQIRVGQKVRFKFDGNELAGFVNRIGLRATVLVEDPRGRRYSDGGRYAKYLVAAKRLMREE